MQRGRRDKALRTLEAILYGDSDDEEAMIVSCFVKIVSCPMIACKMHWRYIVEREIVTGRSCASILEVGEHVSIGVFTMRTIRFHRISFGIELKSIRSRDGQHSKYNLLENATLTRSHLHHSQSSVNKAP